MDSSSSDDEVNEEVNVDQTVIPDIQEEKTKLNSLKIVSWYQSGLLRIRSNLFDFN